MAGIYSQSLEIANDYGILESPRLEKLRQGWPVGDGSIFDVSDFNAKYLDRTNLSCEGSAIDTNSGRSRSFIAERPKAKGAIEFMWRFGPHEILLEVPNSGSAATLTSKKIVRVIYPASFASFTSIKAGNDKVELVRKIDLSNPKAWWILSDLMLEFDGLRGEVAIEKACVTFNKFTKQWEFQDISSAN